MLAHRRARMSHARARVAEGADAQATEARCPEPSSTPALRQAAAHSWTRHHPILISVAMTALIVGCNSPEATRMRSGGSGGDIGNRGKVVQMHEGARPYWRTPERLAKNVGMRDLGPAQQSDRASRGQPAAAPRP